MGSDIEINAWALDDDSPVAWAVAEVERLEACWSRFRPDTELSALNRAAGSGAFVCSPTLWVALERAAVGFERTGGLFDPTVLASLSALGYDRTFREVAPSSPHPAAARSVPGFDAVVLEPARRVVVLPAGVQVDLGGLGKGLAADLLVEGLQARGVTSGMVSMGGDLRVFGPGADDDDAWVVPVEHPADDEVLFRFPLSEEAIVQSTRLMRRWERGGRVLHHLIDPRTGWPAETGLDAVIATARETWFAEVVAKAVLVAGEADGLALAERLGVDVWLVRTDRTLVSTPHVADTLGQSGGR
jgi:thiamine biosynthesis lipoprotein